MTNISVNTKITKIHLLAATVDVADVRRAALSRHDAHEVPVLISGGTESNTSEHSRNLIEHSADLLLLLLGYAVLSRRVRQCVNCD